MSSLEILLSTRNPPWDPSENLSRFIEPLETDPIIHTCDMRDYLEEKGVKATYHNEVGCGLTANGVKFAYKPIRTDIGDNDGAEAVAEALAYRIYRDHITPKTGFNFVPPTVVRPMSDGQVASCQYFVETNEEEDMFAYWYWQKVFDVKGGADPDHIKEMAVFNSIFNNWDRHPGNYMATNRNGKFYLASIDNEAIKYRGVLEEWGKRPFIPIVETSEKEAQVKKSIFSVDVENRKKFNFHMNPYKFNLSEDTVSGIFEILSEKKDPPFPRVCVDQGSLMVRYHEATDMMFPLPQGPYSETLVEAYRTLNIEQLRHDYMSLVPYGQKYAALFSDVMDRRDLFLTAAIENMKIVEEV